MKNQERILTVLGTVLLLGLAWAVFTWWVNRVYDDVSPSVEAFADQFYSHYNQRAYDTIYKQMTDPEFRESYGLDDFRLFLEEVQSGVGAYKDREMYSWRIRWKRDGMYFYIEYDVTYENGTTNENFLLKKKEGSWGIVWYEFV